MGTPARNRMQIAPFPVKQQGKTKCFKRCICLSKAYLSADDQHFTPYFCLKTVGGRWKIRVEDKGLKNAIFHPDISLIIRIINAKRWKVEDGRSKCRQIKFVELTLFIPAPSFRRAGRRTTATA
jgi:hypothetical protein